MPKGNSTKRKRQVDIFQLSLAPGVTNTARFNSTASYDRDDDADYLDLQINLRFSLEKSARYE